MTHRKARPLAMFALCLAAGPSATPATEPAVPPGVVYKPTTDAVNARAINKVKAACGPAATDEQIASLFDKALICGPGLWAELKDDPSVAKLDKADVTLAVPYTPAGGGRQKVHKLHGKVFQSKPAAVAFWKAVRAGADLSHVSVRKLTGPELGVYWSMISFDVTEPVFVAECGRRHLLLHFASPDDLTVLWTDDLATYAAANPATRPAARP